MRGRRGKKVKEGVNKSNRNVGLSKQRFWRRINVTFVSGLLSTLLIFFLTYYFIESTKQAHTNEDIQRIKADIRKTAVETTRAELENKVNEVWAKYAEQNQQLSNKLKQLEIDVKESEKEIAAITAKTKQVQVEADIRKTAVETTRAELEIRIKNIENKYAEQIQKLDYELKILQLQKTKTEAKYTESKEKQDVGKSANALAASVVPTIAFISSNLNIKLQDKKNILYASMDLRNDGMHTVLAQIRIDITAQNSDNKISGYALYGVDKTDILSQQQMRRVYEIHLLPNFYNNIAEKRGFVLWVYHNFVTDQAIVDAVTSQVSPQYTKGQIKGKSNYTHYRRFNFECWRQNDQSFHCG